MARHAARSERTPQTPLKNSSRWVDVAIAIALGVVSLAVYARVFGFDFVWYDDDLYVLGNERVQRGLTWENFVWAFRAVEASNWHPMTWLSHMLDIELWGMRAGGHHFTSVALHAANSVLVFIALHRLTGARWRSAMVAALFALHPLHVESVAWVAERKDVLSTFFGLLALIAWAGYAKQPNVWRYLSVVVWFALSLMSKPMLVTLPCVLLLLDYWPLRRFSLGGQGLGKAIVEKLPLFAMTVASSVVTYIAQQSSGAMYSTMLLPLDQRVANSIVAYAMYLGKTIWPSGLAVLYPHPGVWPAAVVALCVMILLALTAVSIVYLRKWPHLMVGWLFFLGTLVPVIGFVQVGFQSMADRYTYVPLLGVFIMVAWSLPNLTAKAHQVRIAGVATISIVLIGLSAMTVMQSGYWRDSETLFRRALAVTQRNFIIHYNLGFVLRKQNRNEEAIEEFQKSLAVLEIYAPTHDNLGNALAALDRYEEAMKHYQRSIELMPESAIARSNLGSVLAKLGRLDEAAIVYREALQRDPKNADVHANLGEVLIHLRRWPEAADAFSGALAINPQHVKAHIGLGRALAVLGRMDECFSHLRRALELDPNNQDATMYLQRFQEAHERMQQQN